MKKHEQTLPTKGMQRIVNITIGVLFLILAVFFITSCKKEPQPQPQGKEITVNVSTQGLIEKPLTKSFDLSTWQYNYNPNAYELKFTGINNTYTFLKSIQELQSGFEVSIMPDNYIITYVTKHDMSTGYSPVDDKLDICINQTKSIATSQDLTLEANNDDYLIIVDNGSTNVAYWNEVQMSSKDFFPSPDPNQNYKYAYLNVEGNIQINYRLNGENQSKIIPNAKKNTVYHIVTAANGTSTINILPFDYITIGW